ncbi:MAG: carbamoyltransferase [Acidobacteria bacterium]|nr:MAG: carbamoyltransferase [Acidobacteriota bacterium]PYR51943.1 MAG: carbamoyltransferase [Acidobacteriota bacterium]
MNILGLNAFHGDSSAALLANGQLAFAIEEERLNRIKHWAGFPILSAQACLKGSDAGALEHVAISRNPRAHFWSKLARVAIRPGDWGRTAARAKNVIEVSRLAGRLTDAGIPNADRVRVHFVEHHRAHLASAFFASPFDEAAVVSIDGFGDFSSVMWGVGSGHHIDVRGCVRFPHSLGIFYTAFTQLLGFPKYGDEYKMMGLAAYGDPRFAEQVRDVVRVEGDQVRLSLDYFTHHANGVEMSWDDGEPSIGPIYSKKMADVFGAARMPRSELGPQHADLAASVQLVLEECYFALLNQLHRQTGVKKLCLAGGVALNCVANGMIFQRTPFQDVYVQPAAHDAGTSIGAALHVWHQTLNKPRDFVMQHAYYGPGYDVAEVEAVLSQSAVPFERFSEGELVDRTARELAAGRIVGWFQGRMEFGPRALGARSILADPRRKDMKDILNARIKFREPFRPFCPSVLAEATGDFFETDYPSPFMVQAYKIKLNQQQRIPAVTHADGTGRLQTVERDVNPLYWNLLKRFGELTGVPILINTSFNENEPIVNTPAQALDCFLRTNMDGLVMGPFVALKSADARERNAAQRPASVDQLKHVATLR